MNNLSDFNHYIQRLHERHQEFVELVPLTALWNMREFDRREEPKWGQEESDKDIDDLKISIEDNGFLNPVRIEYYFHAGRAIIREGNHRIRAAFEMGVKYVPALAYISDYSFKENATHLDMPTFPKSISKDELEPFYRPSQLNIAGCLTLSGEPVIPNIEWAHQLIEDFENEEPEPVKFRTIRGKINDAVIRTGVEVTYDMNDFDEAHKLYALFGTGCADYLQKDAANHIKRDITMYAKEKEWRDVFISRFESDKKPGELLGLDYRNYITRLLINNSETEVSPSTAPTLSDIELVYELEDYEVFDDVCSSLYKVFYDDWAVREANRKVKKFYGTYFDFVHGGDFNIETYRLNTMNEITIEFDAERLDDFRHIQEDDTSMKDILVREFKKEGYTASFEENNRDSYYAYLDPKFTFDNIKMALKKLVK